jgi:anti-anti-sigma factor
MNTRSRLFAASVALAIGAASLTSSHAAELTIRQRQADDITILDLKGNITEDGGAAVLHKAIRGLLDEGKIKILLNFKGVGDADDAGIGEMLAAHKAAKAKEGRLGFCNIAETLAETLDAAKLLTAFSVFQTEQEALDKGLQ